MLLSRLLLARWGTWRLVALAFACWGVLAGTPTAGLGQTASVLVQANVEGATVLVDGQSAGRTDGEGKLYEEGIDPGRHTIRMRKEGYAEASKTVTLEAGLTKTVPFELASTNSQSSTDSQNRGALLIETSTENATVFLDGEELGQTDSAGRAYFSGIEPGRHRVTVRKQGFEPAAGAVQYDGTGLDRTVELRLRREDRTGTENTSTDNSGSDNSGESSPGGSAGGEASSGEAGNGTSENPSQPENERETSSTSSGTGDANTSGTSEPKTRLVIDANVGGASVYVGGTYRGRTTSGGTRELTLRPGRYQVRVTKEGFSSRQRVARIESGGNHTLGFTLNRTSRPGTEGDTSNVPLILALLLVGAIGIVAIVLVVVVRGDSGAGSTAAQSRVQGSGTFDRYRLLKMLGRGGMATVHLAEDPVEERQVALKLLDASHHDDPDLVRKFLKEAEALQRINDSHPDAPVVQAFRFGRENGTSQGRPYVALEHVPGDNLLTHLKGSGPLGAREALHVLRQVCEGLRAAHANQIWHRDVTPGNVILRQKQPQFEVTLIDFGVAKREYTSRGTMDGSIMGKPPYMSPEQCRNDDVDGRSDVYSAGILFYTMTIGEPPFTDDNPLQVMQMHEQAPRPDLPGHVPQRVKTLVYRMISKNPDDRPDAATVVRSTEELRMAP